MLFDVNAPAVRTGCGNFLILIKVTDNFQFELLPVSWNWSYFLNRLHYIIRVSTSCPNDNTHQSMMHIRINDFLCLKYLPEFCPHRIRNNFNAQALGVNSSISSNTIICNNHRPTIAAIVVGSSINLLYRVFAKDCIEILALNIKCILSFLNPLLGHYINATVIFSVTVRIET